MTPALRRLVRHNAKAFNANGLAPICFAPTEPPTQVPELPLVGQSPFPSQVRWLGKSPKIDLRHTCGATSTECVTMMVGRAAASPDVASNIFK